MPADKALKGDDDYVVSLLLKDAEANRKRYLTNGLGPLLSRRPTGNAPKPNTRFLKSIVREADSHNAALKAKEEGESRARLDRLRGVKRSRDEEVDEGASKRRRGDDKPGRWASALAGLGGRVERTAEKPAKDQRLIAAGSKRDYRSRQERARELQGEDSARHRRKHNADSVRRARSGSPKPRKEQRRRSKSRSPPSSHSGRFVPPLKRNRRSSPDDRIHDRKRDDEDAESDPLEDLLGPKPPPQIHPRGRGAHKSAFDSMDARFSPSYNPKTDVDLSSGEGDRDDWDMALEALRDRAKWRAKGAERLRAAGFTEDEVEKWEQGGGGLAGGGDGDGTEKGAEDVRWRKKGEGREWDRGKVVDGDGVSVKPEWGRLKGS